MPPRSARGGTSCGHRGNDVTWVNVEAEVPPTPLTAVTIKAFKRLNCPTFVGADKPEETQAWFGKLEKRFKLLNINDHQKVVVTAYQLENDRTLSAKEEHALTLARLQEIFLAKYFPRNVKDDMVEEFLISGDGQGGSSFANGQSDDELSTNYGGLDLEALSRLDGRRWSSSCRSQEGLELVAVNRDGEEESMTESIRTLSQKYRPMFFEELIGQNIVVQSLMNAILRGRVASLYLFQGPRGTGKTSTARVLAAALNCLASNKTKLCG
ncbi:hypothetical protein RJ639_025813, partial [Escallonia herrerae]